MLKYLSSQDGASSAEYALLLAAVGGIVGIALFIFGAAIAGQVSSTASIVATGSASNGAGGSSGNPGIGDGVGGGRGH
jgi:hypothetical protein